MFERSSTMHRQTGSVPVPSDRLRGGGTGAGHPQGAPRNATSGRTINGSSEKLVPCGVNCHDLRVARVRLTGEGGTFVPFLRAFATLR